MGFEQVRQCRAHDLPTRKRHNLSPRSTQVKPCLRLGGTIGVRARGARGHLAGELTASSQLLSMYE